jgi:hypothetical protein
MSDDQALPDDEAFLRLMRGALAEPGPSDDTFQAIVSAAFELNLTGVELAVLLYDSDLESPESDQGTEHVGSGYRDRESTERVVRVRAGEIEITLERQPTGALAGRVSPVSAMAASLETPAGRTPLRLDDLGRFTTPAETAIVRVRLELSDGRIVVTPWTRF